jgi:hypothetical protein
VRRGQSALTERERGVIRAITIYRGREREREAGRLK